MPRVAAGVGGQARLVQADDGKGERDKEPGLRITRHVSRAVSQPHSTNLRTPYNGSPVSYAPTIAAMCPQSLSTLISCHVTSCRDITQRDDELQDDGLCNHLNSVTWPTIARLGMFSSPGSAGRAQEADATCVTF